MSLTQAQFAEKLRAKIESREAFDALLIEAHPYNADYIPKKTAKPGDAGSFYSIDNLRPSPLAAWTARPFDPTTGNHCLFPGARWWVVRELLRAAHGVYMECEGTLQTVSAHAAHFMIHPSSSDPTMVAYTPDPESGEKDRQLATTLSKFCRRYWPTLTDDRIRDIEAEYRAYALGEVEFITGPDIAKAYLEAGAVGACMSKSSAAYSAGGHTPPEVYDAPGVALAVVRNAQKQINGRTLTWVNPENAEDKRIIRVYGDTVLLTRLKRQGFKIGTFEGAKLKLIPISGSKTRYVAPYLDGNGSGTSQEWATLVRANGWLRVLPRSQYRSSTFADYTTVPGTSGYVDLPKDASHLFEYTCAIDGKEYKATDKLALILKDGQVRRVNSANLATGEWLGPFKMRHGNAWADCYVQERNVFEHKGDTYVETPENRSELGFVELDAQRYADMTCRWVPKTDATQLPDGQRWLKPEHCLQAIRWVSGKATQAVVEIADGQSADDMVAAGALMEVHRVGSVRTFAAPDVPTKLTRSGSKVVRGIHKDLRIMPDNGLEFKRNVEIRVVMEVRWHALIDTTEALDVASIPTTNLLDRVFNDFAVFYMTQIPTTRRDDRNGPWGPGTWNNFMNCWLDHNREFEAVVPVLSPAGTHVIAGPWPALPNYNSANNALMRQQYVDFARLCEKICNGSVEFADSVDAQQKRRFIEMARITRELRLRAARSLGEFPHSLTDDSRIGEAANPRPRAASATAEAAPAVEAPAAEPVTLERFLIAE